MAKVKKSSDKLTMWHIIGQGCGDAGGCVAMVSIWYLMFRYLQMNMEVNPGDLVSIPVIAVGTIAFYWIPERLGGGFPMLAAVGSFCCFTFIWCINKDVCAKMAAWKGTKLAE